MTEGEFAEIEVALRRLEPVGERRPLIAEPREEAEDMAED